MKLSAVIITYNEEKNIARCLDSLVDVADEILVVDSFSTDRTEQICLERGVIFVQNPFEGHIQQKNYAMNKASYEWVLSLDADEALDDTLRNSILEVKSNNQFDAYEFNRLTYYCGKWIRHGGWYPDRKTRLWNRNIGEWGGVNPHDKVQLKEEARLGRLKGDILHYSFYTIDQHKDQIEKFTTIAARAGFESGRKTNFVSRFLGPIFTFLKMYFFKLGVLDGYYGFVIAWKSSKYKYLKESKLLELYRSK